MYWHGEIPRESGEHHIIKELVLLLTHRAIRAGFARMLYYPLGDYCNPKKIPVQREVSQDCRSVSSCAGNQQQS